MALSYQTSNGLLIIPGAYGSWETASNPNGLATTGVLMLVGEAASGDRFSVEADLEDTCSFGPDAYADVLAKYESGPLVDAFREAIAASNDPAITSSFQRAVLVKTNAGVKASGTLATGGGGTWGTLAAKKAGANGNFLSHVTTAYQAEVKPTTGLFTFIPPCVISGGSAPGAVAIDYRINGGAAVTQTIVEGATPFALVAAVNGLGGTPLVAAGGADRLVITNANTVAQDRLGITVVAGNRVTFNITTSAGAPITFSGTAAVGDTIVINTASGIKGVGTENAGSYVITAYTSALISATKLADFTRVATPNTITPPSTVVPAAGTKCTSTTTDLQVFGSVSITPSVSSPSVLDGVGKTLEISDLGSATGRLEYCCYALGTTTAVTWISKVATATNLASTAEYMPKIVVARALDSVSEDIYEGGRVALQLGYLGTSGQCVIANGVMTITVVGGTGASPAAITLASYPTIGDLVGYLNSLTGFSAAVGSAAMGSVSPTRLDAGTFYIASTFGAKNGRIKNDAYRVFTRINQSQYVGIATQPVSGAPAAKALSFLSAGSKGASADSDFAAAYTALEAVSGNFLVPLVSCDASVDIADGLTDTSSTYTVAGVVAGAKTHVLSMSTMKRKHARQAVCSIRDTFTNAKALAGTTGSFRVNMTFQDVRTSNASGSVVQQRPWMAAAKAAGMQAAAGYRSLMRKLVNINGAVQNAADFKPTLDSQVEDALLAGLMPLQRTNTGSWYWTSDQSTYSKDDNWIYNTLQGVYASDVVAATLQEGLQAAGVGQSIADFGAPNAKSVTEYLMEQLFRQKWIASSSDAPKGYKNLIVQLAGNVISVSIEIKTANAIAFIPIGIKVTQITQTA